MVIVIVGAIFAPFVLLGGGPWVAASFVTLSRLASWSTPWALIDGNWGPGDAGPLSTRFDLAAIYHLPGNPPSFPALTIIVFGAIYLWLFRRPIDLANPRHFHLVLHVDAADLRAVVQRLESAVGDVDHSVFPAVISESARAGAGAGVDGHPLYRMAVVRCAANRRGCWRWPC